MNYANHYLYFSMLQLCNRINTVDAGIVMSLTNKLNINSQTIYNGNQTILAIDSLIKKFEFPEKLINTPEVIDTKLPTKCNDYHETRTTTKPNFFVEVMPSLIDFEILSNYRTGKPNLNLFSKKTIGRMSASLRAKKILKFKLKNFKHRKSIPLERKFKGRSEIAKSKMRIRGRFVKQKIKKIFSVN
jgi:hypothetical protein